MTGFNETLASNIELVQQFLLEREEYESTASGASYIYVTPDNNDLIDVDFTRNPFIGADAESDNPSLNPDSVQKFFVPNFVATGFDDQGARIFGEGTVATFQPSQGLYQDIVTLGQTERTFDAFEFLIPPEATTTFHTHTNGTEIFYVLGGEPANDNNPGIADNDDVVFELNADADGVFNVADPTNPFSVVKDSEIEINGVKVTKGSFVSVPAGKIHTWANTGQIPARVLTFLVPGGISEGFNTVGAPAGIFDPSPEPHPILEADGTNNLIPTGNTPTEVTGLVPEDPNFYDFVQQVQTQPQALELLGFTDFPTYIEGAGPLITYGISADGSGAFKIDPSDEAGVGGVGNPQGGSALVGDDSPGVDDAVPAPMDPFLGTTFNEPFTLLRFGQNDGPLNPTPINTKLFSINNSQSYDVTSQNHELFGVLSGEVIFEFGEEGGNVTQQIASEGDYVYIEPRNHFQLQGALNGANLIQFSALVEPVLDTPVYRFQNTQLPGSYVYVLEEERQLILQNHTNYVEEGIAFNVAVTAGDDLMPIYRFQNTVVPGTFIYVDESERQSILQNHTDYVEEGIAFYTYSADANQAQDIYRFQNSQIPTAYLYVGEAERQAILASSSIFVEQGVAFEALT
jgi:mannose-6-phosphate isomerase-like protein (cupin superfamily)